MLHGSIKHDFNGRKRKSKKVKGEVYAKYSPRVSTVEVKQTSAYRRDADMPVIPSAVDSGAMHTGKVESMKYTGNELAGIATLHKSNAVPVRKGTDEAKEIARMRRN